MGIYTNMLRESEEFMGNTGFDSDLVVGPDDEYTQSLADIEKATVEEINAEYAEESEQKELDGQDLDSNPMEEAAIAIYESERNWNMILKAMGQHELQEASRGRDVIMEAVDVKGWLGKIKQFFVDLWNKVSGAVSKWASQVKATFAKQKAKVDEKFYTRVREGAAKYSGKGFKGVDFSDASAGSVFTDNIEEAYDDRLKNMKNILNGISNIVADLDKEDSYAGAADMARTSFPEFDEKKNKDSINELNDNLEEMFKKVRLHDGNKPLVKCATAEYVIAVLKDGMMGDLKRILKMYSTARKTYSDIIKVLNNIEKHIKKENKNLEQKIPSLNGQITFLKKEKQNEFKVLTSTMRIIVARYRQCRKIANVYAAASLKKEKSEEKKPEAQNASYTGFFAGLQMV